MKKTGIILFIILSGIVFSENNLLKNGDFEKSDKNNIPANWKIWGKGEAIIDKEIKYDGKSSLKISLKEKGSIYIQSDLFSVKPDTLYLITLWYKSENFKTDKPEYSGASASSNIIFYTENKKEIPRYNLVSLSAGYPWSMGFPYKNVKNWQIGNLIVSSPSNAKFASFRIGISSTNNDVLPIIHLDNIWIREYKPPEAKGKTYIYQAEKMHIKNGEIVEDKKAEDGKAVKGKNKKGVIIYGPYTKDQPAGQYKIIFRIKTDDNTENKPVVAVRATTDGFLNSTIATLGIKGIDFKMPGKYQYFFIECVKPPFGWLQFPVSWSGDVSVWVDSIKVIEEKVFTDEDMENFWK